MIACLRKCFHWCFTSIIQEVRIVKWVIHSIDVKLMMLQPIPTQSCSLSSFLLISFLFSPLFGINNINIHNSKFRKENYSHQDQNPVQNSYHSSSYDDLHKHLSFHSLPSSSHPQSEAQANYKDVVQPSPFDSQNR